MKKRLPMLGVKVIKKPPKQRNPSVISQKGKQRRPITLPKTEKPK